MERMRERKACSRGPQGKSLEKGGAKEIRTPDLFDANAG
jgi:hypothetical protein